MTKYAPVRRPPTFAAFRAKRDHRFGYLAVTAILPAAVVTVPFLWYEEVLSLQTWLAWIESPFIQGASSFGVGAILAIVVWRATGPKRFEEPA